MPGMMIAVIKRNLAGEETWRYEGEILQCRPDGVILEAFFNRADMPFVDVVLKKGDRFVEWFYTDRWYNIFQIQDRDDGQVKGWYCNIGRPAVWDVEGSISYIDLALDLWINAHGEQFVLDEDEFDALGLDDETRHMALMALAELQQGFETRRPPI